MSRQMENKNTVDGGIPALEAVEVREPRIAQIGSMGVVRALPTKGRRTIGAWCLMDVIVPPDAIEPDPLEIGPHPHIGLSTATWLFEGEAIHSDSLGTEQPIRPGQLNLMSAGNGIAHAEISHEKGVHGIQMWIAQPEETRHGARSFEHHADLPIADIGAGEAKVFAGSLAGVTSPASSDTPLVGAELALQPGEVVLEAEASFEYAVVPVGGPMLVNGAVVESGHLGMILGGTETLRIEAKDAATAMLIGGEPLGERIQMWWNFVGRTRAELEQAWRDWQAGDTDRFPAFPSTLDRIDAPKPIWVR